MTPINHRRIAQFRTNRRGVASLIVFGVLFLLTLFAELLANDRPIVIRYDGAFYYPILRDYPETVFGGDLPTNAVYTDVEVVHLIEAKGWMLWPLLPYRYDTRASGEQRNALLAPSLEHPLGTDDQARDVLARVIYGFRISVLFGFTLTVLSLIVGVVCFGIWTPTPHAGANTRDALLVPSLIAAYPLTFVSVYCSVALAGVIGFVGLVIPHMLRLTGLTDHRRLLPGCALAGASVLLLADVMARIALPSAELPIGVVTATLGAPIFIWLLTRIRG